MDSKKAILILSAAIMLFSVIPIAFLNSKNTVPEPDINNDSLVLTGDGVFNAKIMRMNQYLSFVGLSNTNDDSKIREAINSIGYVNCSENSADCQVKVGLNPYGAGYRDEVIIKLKNESDANYVGFRLSYRLNYLLDTTPKYLSSYALVPASVILTGNSTIKDKTVIAKNISSLAYVSYTNSPGSIVKVECSNVVYSKQGVLMKAPSCIDTPQVYGNKFGLNYFTIIQNQKQFNKSLELNLSFDAAVFEAEGNFTGSGLDKKLSFARIYFAPDNQSASIIVENISKVAEIREALKNYNITKEYKTGDIKFPSKIQLDGKEYDVLTDNGLIRLDFPITQLEGEQEVKLKIMTLFDEIVKIETAEN